MAKILFLLLTFLLSAITLAIMLIGVYLQINESGSAHWPTTIATIDAAEISEVRGKRGVTYCPRWTYHFVVNGKQYKSQVTHFGTIKSLYYSCFDWRKVVEGRLKRHQVGSQVMIVYNPKNPKYAALIPADEEYFVHIMVGVGMLFGTMSMIVLLFIAKFIMRW